MGADVALFGFPEIYVRVVIEKLLTKFFCKNFKAYFLAEDMMSRTVRKWMMEKNTELFIFDSHNAYPACLVKKGVYSNTAKAACKPHREVYTSFRNTTKTYIQKSTCSQHAPIQS